MSLNQWFYSNTSTPVNKWTHYLPIYERYFRHLRDRHVVFLEIGSGQGGSSQMWKQFFGPAARIVTIDIREECKAFADEQVAVRVGDQSSGAFLQSLLDEFGPFDAVLDDGSHQMAHVNATFDYLYPRLARDAVYMVEDLHTAYLEEYGGGLRRSGTFMERVKGYIDEMHAHYTAGQQPETEVGKITRSIHIYDSIVVFEKGPFVVKTPKSIPYDPNAVIW